MAEEKSEDPTEGRKREARLKGQVVKSQDLISALTLAVSFAIVVGLMSTLATLSNEILTTSLGTLGVATDPLNALRKSIGGIIRVLMVALLPTMVVSALAGLLLNLVMTGFNASTHAITPDPNKINPLNALKKWFSSQTAMEAVKLVLKSLAMTWIVWDYCLEEYGEFLTLQRLEMDQFRGPFESIVDLCWKLIAVQGVFGVMDYGIQYYQHRQSMKMTKQEVKDEYKKQEGDPLIKAQRRARGRRMIKSAGLKNLAKASVVITNPTHLAVALEYHFGLRAPVVVSKGADQIAFEIRRRAAVLGIPIVEDKPLARALFPLELEQTIPPELFQAVAQLLLSVREADDYL